MRKENLKSFLPRDRLSSTTEKWRTSAGAPTEKTTPDMAQNSPKSPSVEHPAKRFKQTDALVSPTPTSNLVPLPDELDGAVLYSSSWPDARNDEARDLFTAAVGPADRELVVVNLCAVAERRKFAPYDDVARAVAGRRTMLSYPTPDRKPLDDSLLRTAVQDIVAALRRGCGVVVHCYGGHGRTGLVVAGVLAVIWRLQCPQRAGEMFLSAHATRTRARSGFSRTRPLTYPQCRAQREQAERMIAIVDEI